MPPFSTRLFSQTITIQEFVSIDAYNHASYGTVHTVKCREETDYNYLRDNFREIQTSDSFVYVYSPNYVPKINDKVTLIDGNIYPIKQIIRNRNDIGEVKFYTIQLGIQYY